jgi:predicted dithiol-disulfide oxidoreductase (DUF899 family)
VNNMTTHTTATREDWLTARKALLAREREMTHALDRLRAERRALPWVKLDKDYVFDGPDGQRSLSDLFGARSQLAVYHFMLTPGSDHQCAGCSFIADHIDAARRHFEHADLAFAAISRAPLARIEQVKQRMGWTFPWLSAHDSDFNYDFGVSFRKDDIAAGRALYNFGVTTIKESEDMHGISVFAKDASGQVHHTYSTYHRGDEMTMGAFMWLDLAPKGRNEADGIMSWIKLHDEYPQDDAAPKAGCCGG